MKRVVINLPLLLALVFAGCQKDVSTNTNDPLVISAVSASDKANTFYGPQVQIGNGKARSWIRISKSGEPEELGVELTPGALQGLPDSQPGYAYVLPLHQKAQAVTPYDHISFDWNPHGHEPAHVFDVPHFDIHFYMISLADQMAIPAPSPSTMPMFMNINPSNLPADYTIPGGPVPQMGMHWLDRTSNLFQGVPFSQVLIYGTFNGRVIFVEPMITRALLLSSPDITAPLKQPSVYNPTGTNYPTEYNIYTDSKTGNIMISLGSFTAVP
ncbi:MAG: DUF5602 domain-containing protein [Candidatus Dadabacteria bacterium]